jgi:hypothetical protein
MTYESDFTHILDIKVIHLSDGNIVRNKDLLKQVKRYLLDQSFPHTLRCVPNESDRTILGWRKNLSWKRKKWPSPYDKFIGDLVTNSIHNADLLVQEDVTIRVKYILEDLREKFNYWKDFDVVFNISKPLSIVKPLHCFTEVFPVDET